MSSIKAPGIALAMTAATVFLTGCASTGDSNSVESEQVALVKCGGVNVCKGHNDCKSANNQCAGSASCKGKGFVLLPEKACGDVGGEIVP